MTDDFRRFRMTCPVLTTCPWRGPIVRASGMRGVAHDDEGLDYHLQLEHPDVPPLLTLWETWERVWPEPYSRRQRLIIGAAWAVGLVAPPRAARTARRGLWVLLGATLASASACVVTRSPDLTVVVLVTGWGLLGWIVFWTWVFRGAR